jgi:hypothetical protein
VYSGIVSLDERIQAVQEVCESYGNCMPYRILINFCDLEMHMSFDEQQTFGRYLGNHQGLTNARVAVLFQRGHNPNVIIDTSAYLSGYLIAQFDDKQKAEYWLALYSLANFGFSGSYQFIVDAPRSFEVQARYNF